MKYTRIWLEQRHNLHTVFSISVLNYVSPLLWTVSSCCVASALDLLLLVSMFFISLKNSEKFWFSIWWNKHQDEGERERKKSQPFEVSGWKEIGGESKREKREAISSRRHFWHLFVYLCTYVQFSFCFALFTLCLPFFRVSLHLRCHEYGWSWSVLFLFFFCVCLPLFISPFRNSSAIIASLLYSYWLFA